MQAWSTVGGHLVCLKDDLRELPEELDLFLRGGLWSSHRPDVRVVLNAWSEHVGGLPQA